MNNKHYKWLSGAFAAMSLAIVTLSCTDDHFDINPEVSGKQSLWENIESNSNLSEFADILNRVYYSKSEGSSTPQTYADLFSNDQTFTIWAPQNGTFNYSYYDSLLNTGTTANAYKVEKELIRNSMTRFTHQLVGSDVTDLEMFNSKTCLFDCGNATMGGKSITTANIGANNGVLHILNGAIDYNPNLYEYMATRSDLDSLNTFIKGYEKVEFDENSSTQGPTVNGNITWVDSVTYVSNDYFYMLQAYLNREDSNYAMIMPTNEVWSETLEKTRGFYNYRNEYVQSITTTDDTGNSTSSSVTTTLTNEELDSMVNLYSKNAIIQRFVFNANSQFGHSYEDFSVVGACDSLKSTVGTVFYDPLSAELFDGASPVECSNGYAYVVNHFNLPADKAWAQEKRVEAEYTRNIENNTGCTLTQTSIKDDVYYIDADSNLADTTIDLRVMRTVQSTSSSNPTVTFKLQNTLSCKYDIYVLMAYNTNAMLPNLFRAQIAYHKGDENKSSVTNENLTVPASAEATGHGSGRNFTNLAPHLDENGKYQYIDSILVAEDFEFPVCYYGLDNAYVTLKLTSYVTSKQTSTYSREMWIDKIVLKAKEN